MLITILIVAVLLAACLVPLILTGDVTAFFKRDAVLLAAAAVALVVAVLVNLLADKKFGRIDLTAEKKYSISEEMHHIIDRLGEDQAKLTYYVFSSLSAFEPMKRDMLDKLNEIKNASKGRIEIEVVDPQGNAKLLEDLKGKGYLQQVQQASKDEMSLSKIMSGLQITYKDKPSVDIPVIYQSDSLEYELGGKLLELTLDKKPVIALDIPPAPPQANPMMQQRKPQGSGFEWLTQGGIDNKKFDVKSIDLSENNSIPKDAALFIAIRPKEMNERQRYDVEKYLAEGGKVMLLASPFKVSHEFGWKVEKTPTGLEDYLKECGITFGQDFIADKSHLRQPITLNPFTGEEQLFENLFFIKIKPENIDQNTSLTRLMPGLVMPSPAEIKLDKEIISKSKFDAVVLAKTSAESWVVPFSESIEPEKITAPDTFPHPDMPVFVMLKGQFPFPFEGKPVPEWPKAAPSDKEKEKDKDKDKKPETATAAKKPGALVVCTAPEAFFLTYLQHQYTGPQMRGNVELIANISESMSLGDDLMKLRTKRYETRAITGLAGKENESSRQYWKAFLIFGIPILVFIFAIYRFVLRRIRQLAYERKFAGTIGPSSFSAQ